MPFYDTEFQRQDYDYHERLERLVELRDRYPDAVCHYDADGVLHSVTYENGTCCEFACRPTQTGEIVATDDNGNTVSRVRLDGIMLGCTRTSDIAWTRDEVARLAGEAHAARQIRRGMAMLVLERRRAEANAAPALVLTVDPLREHGIHPALQGFMEELVRDSFSDGRAWAYQPGLSPEEKDLPGRTLSPRERLFMLANAGRIESELRWLKANDSRVHQCYAEAKRAGLSETTAAEMAVICLARENEDLRRRAMIGDEWVGLQGSKFVRFPRTPADPEYQI